MISINKAEKEAILKRYPRVCIVRTMRQDSKRHHYYMEEANGPMAMLAAMRGVDKQNKRKKVH